MGINNPELSEIIVKLKAANPKRWNLKKDIKHINLTEEEFRFICLDKKAYTIFQIAVNLEYQKYIFLYYISKYPACIDEVFSKSKIDEFKIYLIDAGYIKNIKYFNILAKSKSVQARLYSVKYCDFSTLTLLSKDKNEKVRIKAFERLGPVESLDKMLTDVAWEIRLMGVKAAPYEYPALATMIDEKSKPVFIELVKKVEVGVLPMMLGNRNMKQKDIREIVYDRFQGEFII